MCVCVCVCVCSEPLAPSLCVSECVCVCVCVSAEFIPCVCVCVVRVWGAGGGDERKFSICVWQNLKLCHHPHHHCIWARPPPPRIGNSKFPPKWINSLTDFCGGPNDSNFLADFFLGGTEWYVPDCLKVKWKNLHFCNSANIFVLQS